MAASVDRLPQLADRLTVFHFEAPTEAIDASLVKALAEELAAAPRLLDKDVFRAVANRVKDRTGLKGKNLFHPIRVILTGAHEGPELDLIVPAIDRAVGLERPRAGRRLPRACGGSRRPVLSRPQISIFHDGSRSPGEAGRRRSTCTICRRNLCHP